MYNTDIDFNYNQMNIGVDSNMRLTQLRYFQKVAQLENFTKAAEHLYISQPALSRQISQLEDELGVTLFSKNGRYVTLNPYGQLFLKHTNKALSEIDMGIEQIMQMKDNDNHYITIQLDVGSLFVPELIKYIKNDYSNTSIKINQHSNQNDSYDYLITSELNQENNFIELYNEDILIAVPLDNPLSKKESISINDLKTESIISLTKDKALRKRLDYYMKKLNVKLHLDYECDDAATLRELLNQAVGITLIPIKSWKKFNTDQFVLKPLTELPLNRTVYLCWNNTNDYLKEHEELIRLIPQFYGEMLK